MKLTPLRVSIAIFALLAATSSYIVGRDGIDVGRAIVESRCSAGAFIPDAKSSAATKDDAHTHTSAAPVSTALASTVAYAPIQTTSGNLIAGGDAVPTGSAASPNGWLTDVYGKNYG